MIDAIESSHSLFLLVLVEPGDNSLRIVVGESSLGDLQDLVVEGAGVIKDVRPVTHRPEDRVFTIEWESYVSYVVTNESWAVYDESGPREGRLFVKFSDSSFLRYLKERTWSDDRPRYHWQVNCENHAIDVVSLVQPIISLGHPKAPDGPRKAPIVYSKEPTTNR